MVTMKDLSEKQKGPWIYTLLDGRALEAVEHLTLTDLVKEDGASTLWTLLTARFPEKESEDQMGEALGEVFALCAKDGETMQQWSSRVHEVFQKCVRKAKVQFPSPAQGWITLNCAGLSEEQKAIVKAKTQGKLEIEVVTAALRSCFPQYKASASRARRPVNTYLVDPDLAVGPEDTVEETDDFEDVEAFLADHGFNEAKQEAEVFQEEEAAEALAVTWKERRKEITKLQQKRGFGKSAEQAKRSFRVEIEELKKRTRCNRCHRFGHWARECKANLGSREGHATSSTTSATNSSTHEVMNADVPKDYAENLGAGLVSSPGFGVVDSGCGRTLIGRETLSTLSTMLSSRVDKEPEVYESTSVFRFGNGATETSAQAVRIPVGISQKLGLIDAAIIEGKAPLLLGRPTLERLNVVLNFRDKSMRFLDQTQAIPMHTNPAGQLLINVLDFPADSQQAREGSVADEPDCVKESLDVKQQECRNDSQTAVAELFCSPCFAEKARAQGGTGLSFSVEQGCDLLDEQTQHEVSKLLDTACPELLLACPPCVRSNRCLLTPVERARLARTARQQVKFCVQEIHRQLKRGGQFLFEHALNSPVWKLPEVQLPVQKATGIISSHPSVGEAFVEAVWTHLGPPKVLVLDPARPNLGEVLAEFCNNQGIAVEQTATGSHWQLGKVERHGGWFQNILQRVLDDVRPTSEEEYLTCIVQTQSAKNSLLTEAGASPYQYVFGRNPRVPTDLLQDAPDLAASDAVASDPSCQHAHVVRQTARRAVLECQDDRALRAALRARPRVHREFQSGDWVYYWRTQKSLDGTRIEGGRWYGAAMVLGRVGRNLVVAHKRSIMRCSPEQLRPATDEESTVAVFPDNELLGIRVLLEKGQFPRSQFIDLVGQPEAPNPIEPDGNPAAADLGHAMSAGQLFEGRHEAQIPANRSETRAEPQLVQALNAALEVKAPSVKLVVSQVTSLPLYAEQPEGGIPGLDPEDVLEVTGNMYGANNAPQEWYRAFDAEARFPYRKWRVGNGEFCGVVYSQDQATFEITFQQKEYARHLRPIALTKERRKDREALATPKEVAALRAVNGAANWLSGQSRPDLAVQTSFSQQSFPEPRVKDLLAANQLVQRAKQHAEVSITVRDIALDQLAIAFHSDAGFANAGANGTQAGYLLAFVHRRLDRDQESNWSPFCWKSYKMARVVASTLAGEAQAFASASGLAEWVSLMTYEAVHGAIDLRESASMLGGSANLHSTFAQSVRETRFALQS
ncbi:GIP, partial [Symbiodinium sp. CCMP2456]